ncbi:acyl-CoA dehydrogenase family protein [Paenarthrobacter sp. NEAU-H11]|uniref:acyl-CoA dehydrogenase family protein n=1 Tax=Paenarthrobacter sp. NEAU-H11 TaxID=3423924 RepID=UPI003D358402
MTQIFDIDPELSATMADVCTPFCGGEALRRAEALGWSPELWNTLTDLELTGVGVGEDHGGSGGSTAEAAELVRVAAYLAAPVPLAERCLIAGPALELAGVALPAGPIAVAAQAPELTLRSTGSSWSISGSMRSVAAGRLASYVVTDIVQNGARVTVLAPVAPKSVTPGMNYACEPRDSIAFHDVPVQVLADQADGSFMVQGALARALQISGALERILEMTLRYAQEREQFGQPIARFQAVAQQLALLGECVANARMASEAAVVSARAEDAIIAKLIAGESATAGAAIAHQVFGALGFTRECDLQFLTRRLWSWRDEFGSESHWAEELGRNITTLGSRDLWDLITA